MSADYHRVCRTSKSCEDRESWWCCRLGGQGKLSTPFCAVCSCNLQENARLAVCACMQVWALCQKCAQSTPCHQPACKKKAHSCSEQVSRRGLLGLVTQAWHGAPSRAPMRPRCSQQSFQRAHLVTGRNDTSKHSLLICWHTRQP